mmetsp:Transcript_137061/g.292730  ORF Transcript_137061/g.292730 Transcript_137061/m.292730 type:complete len:202 (+) Transcript_137061:836-1441(+)
MRQLPFGACARNLRQMSTWGKESVSMKRKWRTLPSAGLGSLRIWPSMEVLMRVTAALRLTLPPCIAVPERTRATDIVEFEGSTISKVEFEEMAIGNVSVIGLIIGLVNGLESAMTVVVSASPCLCVDVVAGADGWDVRTRDIGKAVLVLLRPMVPLPRRSRSSLPTRDFSRREELRFPRPPLRFPLGWLRLPEALAPSKQL